MTAGAAAGTQSAVRSLLGIDFARFSSVGSAASYFAKIAGVARAAVVVHTCNVDHVMLMQHDPDFASAYREADFVTVDGAPIVALARIAGRPIGPRITGSDLVPELVREAARLGKRVALVGSTEASVTAAACRLEQLNPGLPEVLAIAPPMGFKIGGLADLEVVECLRNKHPEIVVVGLGAPKQELWMHHHRAVLPGALLIGAGAAIDFLSGHQRRAPRLLRAFGMEWLYRLSVEFPRLWRRYLLRDICFPYVVAKHLLEAAWITRR